MSKPPATNTRHPSDTELVQRLDGELDDAHATAIERHINGCPACRHRFEEFAAADRTWKDLLGVTRMPPTPSFRTPPVGDRRRTYRRRIGLAAAIAAAMALTSLPPVRTAAAEIARQLLRVLDLARSSEPGPTSVGPPVSKQPAPADEVVFSPASRSLVIDFAAAQSTGSLTLRRGPGTRVSLGVLDSPGPTIVLLRDTVRILNVDTTTASYHLALPAGVSRLTVLLAGEHLLHVDRRQLGPDGREIVLRP